jgi:hypothetical protein
MSDAAERFLSLGERIHAFPVIHGSGDCAVAVREWMLEHSPDCLAVPIPPSFQDDVMEAVHRLPVVSAVVQRDAWAPEGGEEGFSYVPVEPCQPVIAALRTAAGEHLPVHFIDRETPYFESMGGVFPDPYALKKVSLAGFAAALLPSIPPPAEGQHTERIRWMARRLRGLERKHRKVLFVCSLLDWPWVRQAYQQNLPTEPEEDFEPHVEAHLVQPLTLVFFLAELPFIAGLYERGRVRLEDDTHLSVDGVKELAIEARERLRKTHPRTAGRITPQLLRVWLQYARNLALIGRRLTPDLFHLVVASQQTAGDDFALTLAETARDYPYAPVEEPEDGWLRMGINEADVPGWGVAPMSNRLPGQEMAWANLPLRRRPEPREQKQWKQRWDPCGQCSWPPEDDRIESFTAHVRDQAKALIGADLARSEKFTTSVMDGLDIRETLRNWHTGDIYVKVIPPSRGTIEVVVFLFDVPSDPRTYTFRSTWFAEHQNESTLAFYATNPMDKMVGPGIAQAEYGGALFLYPPRPIPDVWTDPRLDFADTLEERLLGAGLLHSRQRHVCVVSPRPPAGAWRRLARRLGRKLVHLPLARFSGQLVERLRVFHVLNGKTVRSYASDFIRDGE